MNIIKIDSNKAMPQTKAAITSKRKHDKAFREYCREYSRLYIASPDSYSIDDKGYVVIKINGAVLPGMSLKRMIQLTRNMKNIPSAV